MKTILITGAAGGIGTYLRREFKGKYTLRLSDREPINTLGEGESFVQADLSDLDAICAAAEGVDGICISVAARVKRPGRRPLAPI